MDFFEFSEGHLKVRSKFACWNAGEITEAVVGDLKQLLLTAQPDASEHWLPQHGREPLKIYGHRVEYAPDAQRFAATKLPTIMLRIDSTSDIWLPWVPWFGGEEFFDNRELAARHSPRLNAFLQTPVSLGASVTFTNMLGEEWVEAMADSGGIRMIDKPPMR